MKLPEKLKSLESVTSDVPIWRRIAAFFLDGCFITFIALSTQLAIGGIESWAGFFKFLGIVFTYAFFDLYYLPHHTGFTLSRWVMRYQILGGDFKYPGYRALLRRGVLLWILGWFWLDILSFIGILARKDKRAFHDLFSNTVTQRTRTKLKLLRVTIYLTGFSLALLSTITYSSIDIYKTFVYPQECSFKGYSKKQLHNIKKLPINPNNSDLIKSFSESGFYLQMSEALMTYGDSLLLFGEDSVKVTVSQTDISVDSLYAELSRLNFLNFENWSHEDAFRLTAIAPLLTPESRFNLLNPLENIRQLYLGILGATILPHFPNASESGLITGKYAGIYAWFEKKQNDMIVFEIYDGDIIHSVRFFVKPQNRAIPRYLLNNVGFSD